MAVFLSIFKIASILCLMLSVTGTTIKRTKRITGGYDEIYATYQASIRIRNSKIYSGFAHICGGTLITYNFVLTVAHCFFKTENHRRGKIVEKRSRFDLLIVLGSTYLHKKTSSTFESPVERYAIHRKFNLSTLTNDIGMVKLVRFVRNNPVIRPVPIAASMISDKTVCEISGWGKTSHEGAEKPSLVLSTTIVSIVNRDECNSIYAHYQNPLPPDPGMFCAGERNGRDACQGDSGGPLVCDGILYGIISSGVNCGSPIFPGFYTNVPYYYDWIIYVLGDGSDELLARKMLILFAALIVLIRNFNWNN